MINKLEKCLHPMFTRRDQKWFYHKTQAEIQKQDLGCLILQVFYNVSYVIGYTSPVRNSVAVIPTEGNVHLLISTLESADVYASTQDVDAREFMSWVFIDNGTKESRRNKGDVIDPDAIIHICLDLIENTPMDDKVGTEMGNVTYHSYIALTEVLPEGMVVDGPTVTRNCRVVKCQWEIDMLRLAVQEADRARRIMVEEVKPGIPAWKLDVMSSYYASKLNPECGAASRGHDFVPVAGPYHGLYGMPWSYILQADDIIKFDIGYQYLGYWSDVARTPAVGGIAPDEALELYGTLCRADHLGANMFKPGVAMQDVCSAIREEVEKSCLAPKYPRGHMGYPTGCGVGLEEHPTVTPGTDCVPEPSMVACLETPYSGTGSTPVHDGFNLEDAHLITANGYDSFTIMSDSTLWK